MGWQAIGPATMREMKVLLPSLWMQAITEAGEDAEIRRHVRGHMREVHDFFADVLRLVQEQGGIHAERDPDTEAWIFVAGSLLVSVADRLGGLLKAEDFEAIRDRTPPLAHGHAVKVCRKPSESSAQPQAGGRFIRPQASLTAALYNGRKEGAAGGTMGSPSMKTPPAAAPGAFSVRGDPFPGRRAGES